MELVKPMIIVHGGAGDIPQSRVKGKLDGSKTAVIKGFKVLNSGGCALNAVEAAVLSMEDDENFNAGDTGMHDPRLFGTGMYSTELATLDFESLAMKYCAVHSTVVHSGLFNLGYGSVLNLDGEIEMEASVMCGRKLDVGAVTLLKDFKNPITIALKVLTDSPHSLLGGEGAKRFAIEKRFTTVPPESLISPYAKSALEKFLQNREFGRTEIGEEDKGGVGTVGAVAIDKNGNIAVATSTGGMSGKAVGRIGDTPQIGSGTYADNNIGGVSTTGHGESILKYCLAHAIVKLMENGKDANTATKSAVIGMTERLNNTAGAITLSKSGEFGVYFSSKRMSWAFAKDDKILYGIEHGEVFEENYTDNV